MKSLNLIPSFIQPSILSTTLTSYKEAHMNALILSLLFACGQKTAISNPTTKQYAPKWFLQQPELCGVGVVPLADVEGDIGQAKIYAEDNARTDLGRQIETKTGSMIKKYNQSTKGSGEAVSETNRQEVTSSLSKVTLNGAVPEKVEIMNEQYYALVCLKPGALADAINNMNKLSDAQKTAIQKRAKQADIELQDALNNYDSM